MNIHCEQNCLLQYNNIKFKKIQARYLVFSIQNQHIVLEKIGDRNQSWSSFINSFPQNQNRYAVFDAQFTKYDGMAVNKLIFVSWNPDSAPLKMRILYATAKDNFKRNLDMNSKDFTLNCVDDVTEEDMIKELSK